MEYEHQRIRSCIKPPRHADALYELMYAHIYKKPNANFDSNANANAIEREFQKRYGCVFYYVPDEELPRAIDELGRILRQRETKSETIYERKNSFFRNLIHSIGSGLSTSTDDIAAAASLMQSAYQENVFHFLMRANSLTRAHQRYSHNEVGIKIYEANTEGQFTLNYADLVSGSPMSNEQAITYAKKHLRRENYCLVRDWLWVDLEFNDTAKPLLEQRTVLPTLIYAHTIVHDSQNRWRKDAYLRSALLKAHEYDL